MTRSMHFLFLGALVLASFASADAGPEFNLHQPPALEVAAAAGRNRVLAVMQRSSESLKPDEYYGAEGVGGRVVVSISVVAGMDTLFVPRSAYADLANVDSMQVVAKGSRLVVKLVGGEG